MLNNITFEGFEVLKPTKYEFFTNLRMKVCCKCYKYILSFLLLICFSSIYSQQEGAIRVIVHLDGSSGIFIDSARVTIYKNDILVGQSHTDTLGATLILLPSGFKYDMRIMKDLFSTKEIKGVLVSENKTTQLYIGITPDMQGVGKSKKKKRIKLIPSKKK